MPNMTQRPSTGCEYLILVYQAPDKPPRNIGILLWCEAKQALFWRITEDWSHFANRDDAEVLALLSQGFAESVRDLGPRRFLEYLEDTLSNVLRITDRRQVQAHIIEETLDSLYAEHITGPTGEDNSNDT